MDEQIVLMGAGAAGTYALRFLRERGVEPLCFADNNADKWGTTLHGIPVVNPYSVNDPGATWVACAISRPAAPELRKQIRELGVKTKPLWECIPVCHGVPSDKIRKDLAAITYDAQSTLLVNDQCLFRRNPDYDQQVSPSPISELYFPDFITRRDDEVFIDCGAADGDTLTDFLIRWTQWKQIIAFEPDLANYRKLLDRVHGDKKVPRFLPVNAAVGDNSNAVSFIAAGDYSSHVEGVTSRDATEGMRVEVACSKLDDLNYDAPPTYIKMDIEGAELEALWGARRTLKEHAPVLAICAYHTSDHLWQIPLLIHAINPEYKLYFRRYGEGAFEIVWYGVPPERLVR